MIRNRKRISELFPNCRSKVDLLENLNNIIAEQFLHIKEILKAFCLCFKQFPMKLNGAFFPSVPRGLRLLKCLNGATFYEAE